MSGPSRETVNPEDVTDINQTLADVQSYPVLTQEAGYPGSPRSGASGQSGYGQVVQSAIQDILGWRPRTGDAKGFAAALNQSFVVKEVQGHTEWKWTPRTYAIDVDLGAVTGAQAAIYARTRMALDHILPLLDGLTPLRSDPDAQDIDAVRALVKSGLTELAKELGLEGGPRLFRVDELFDLLLGASRRLSEPEEVSGQLGLLRDRFGLQRQHVNTIDEERNLTNYLILVDEVSALRQTWKSQRHFFDRSGRDVFFGTQMVQLSRALGVLAESVEETKDAMDSVFLGEAERQVIKIEVEGEKHLLGGVLDRLGDFASDEGPHLINTAGKDGLLYGFWPTSKRLHKLVSAIFKIIQERSQTLPRGFYTHRVLRAWEELETYTRTVENLANQVKRLPGPYLVRVTPNSGPAGARVRLTIEGARFQAGARARLNLSGRRDISIEGSDVQVISEAMLQATFELDSARPNTTWTVVVINPDGADGRLREAFTIEDAAGIWAIEPNQGTAGTVLLVTILGAGFRRDAQVEFNLPNGPKDALISIGSTIFLSDHMLTAQITIDHEAQFGLRDVVISQADGSRYVLPNGFRVNWRAPKIDSFNPTSLNEDITDPLTIQGEEFREGATVQINPANGVVIDNTVDLSDDGKTLIARVALDSQVIIGEAILTVTNLDGQSDSMGGLVLNPPLGVTHIDGPAGTQGTKKVMQIQGEGFDERTEVSIGEPGENITATVISRSAKRLDVEVDIGADATVKPKGYAITVSNPESRITAQQRFVVSKT